ncbi:hypothetical protein Q9233_017659 [Columba guinea]|nr:hypothetical protein Q9233_017659 [Columba guinea]
MAVPGWLARWPRLAGAGRLAWPRAPRRGAGHNRWSKVRNVKGPRDAERGRTFQRLALLLRSAAREGGPDPALNPQLANVVEQCRANNMPKASIAAAIQSAERPSPDTRLLCEARGPGGAAILLEIITDNPRRSQRDVRLLLAQHGGALWEAPRGGFEEQGVVRVAPSDAHGHPLGLEGALETALDVGATDVEEDDEGAGLKLTELAELTQLTQLTQMAELTQLTQLPKLTQLTEFQVDPVDPVAQVDPADPVDPVDPVAQVDPADLVAQVDPVDRVPS